MAKLEDDYDTLLGDSVAADLLRGNAQMYMKVQGIVLNGLQTGNWVYGNMIMKIIWALLPEEAQTEISESADREKWALLHKKVGR